jgi:hypothetical protein
MWIPTVFNSTRYWWELCCSIFNFLFGVFKIIVCSFPFCHSIVCPFSIYAFWLHLRNRQTFLTWKNALNQTIKTMNVGFSILLLWGYLMKFIPETHRAHYITYLRFNDKFESLKCVNYCLTCTFNVCLLCSHDKH